MIGLNFTEGVPRSRPSPAASNISDHNWLGCQIKHIVDTNFEWTGECKSF